VDDRSGTGSKKGCVTKENIWSVEEQSKVKKNNDKDRYERLVTIIHVFLGKFEDTKWVIRSRKSQDRQYNGQKKPYELQIYHAAPYQ